jgi:hypothetical protein
MKEENTNLFQKLCLLNFFPSVLFNAGFNTDYDKTGSPIIISGLQNLLLTLGKFFQR